MAFFCIIILFLQGKTKKENKVKCLHSVYLGPTSHQDNPEKVAAKAPNFHYVQRMREGEEVTKIDNVN
jgi:hypothetical protein